METVSFLLSKIVMIGLQFETWVIILLILAFTLALRHFARHGAVIDAAIIIGTVLVVMLLIGGLLFAPL